MLRSKTPNPVRQEVDGLMLAYYAVRRLIHAAARHADEDPDRLSFVHAVRVVRRRLQNPGVNVLDSSYWRRFWKSEWSPAAGSGAHGESSGRLAPAPWGTATSQRGSSSETCIVCHRRRQAPTRVVENSSTS